MDYSCSRRGVAEIRTGTCFTQNNSQAQKYLIVRLIHTYLVSLTEYLDNIKTPTNLNTTSR